MRASWRGGRRGRAAHRELPSRTCPGDFQRPEAYVKRPPASRGVLGSGSIGLCARPASFRRGAEIPWLTWHFVCGVEQVGDLVGTPGARPRAISCRRNVCDRPGLAGPKEGSHDSRSPPLPRDR